MNVKTLVKHIHTRTRTQKDISCWKRPVEEIEKEYRAVVAAQRWRGEVEKRKFLCFLLISNSRSSRSVETLENE